MAVGQWTCVFGLRAMEHEIVDQEGSPTTNILPGVEGRSLSCTAGFISFSPGIGITVPFDLAVFVSARPCDHSPRVGGTLVYLGTNPAASEALREYLDRITHGKQFDAKTGSCSWANALTSLTMC